MVESIVVHLEFDDLPPRNKWTEFDEQEYWSRLYGLKDRMSSMDGVRYVEVVNEPD